MSSKKITGAKIISDRLKVLFDESGKKKGVVAERIGVSSGAISQWLSGETAATTQSINALAKEFNVNEEWLAYGTGEKEAKYEVTAVFESKKTAYHPLKQAIHGYVDAMTDEELLEEVTRLAIAAQKREKS